MVLTADSLKRLAKDVKYILKNPLTNDNMNIYYKHDEENILKGYAMIIGNDDTPYSYGYYFFEFNFPDNYPFEPPRVRFLTNDGHMRFHPNLYINGKVCLSILNTWNGEGWTSCQNIRSILIILASIFNTCPLTNEPGINKNNPNIIKYNLSVGFKNIEHSIIKQISIINKPHELDKPESNYRKILLIFKDAVKENFIKNRDAISMNINKLSEMYSNYEYIYISTYNLNYKLDFNKLMSGFEAFKSTYN